MSENENLKWKTEETLRCGLAIRDLAATYREAIEPRVGAPTIDGLGSDLEELRDDTSSAYSSRADRHAATLEQNAALAIGADVVSAIRMALRQTNPAEKSLLADFGVGMPVHPRSVPSVAGSLQIVLDATRKHPDETRAAGIIEEDLRRAQEALTSLTAADATQENRKLTAREATARRRATQLRVQVGISRIVAAACLAFVGQPLVLAKFTSLLPTRGRKLATATPTGPAPQPPATPPPSPT